MKGSFHDDAIQSASGLAFRAAGNEPPPPLDAAAKVVDGARVCIDASQVKAGDAVAEGQVCAILESMKMEMPVEAPAAGTVEKVLVTEGQAVNEGDALVTLA